MAEAIVDDARMKPLIVGCGETGAAILHCYARQGVACDVHDPPKGAHAVLGHYGVVHCCAPPEALAEAIRLCTPDTLVLVHTTTTPGTCAALGHTRLVHAPIEGRHPMLSEYLLKWAMPVSGPAAAVASAVMQLRRAGIPAAPWPGPYETTEIAKHLSTLRLGMDVLFMRACADACRAAGADFARAYREYTRAYNTTYSAEALVRPILAPIQGPMGGHCVGANAEAFAAWAREAGAASLAAAAETVARVAATDWRPTDG